jgi:hypothetical protein
LPVDKCGSQGDGHGQSTQMMLQATFMNRPVLEVADLVHAAETHSWPQILNFDEFHQHLVGAKLPGFRYVANLRCDVYRKADPWRTVLFAELIASVCTQNGASVHSAYSSTRAPIGGCLSLPKTQLADR